MATTHQALIHELQGYLNNRLLERQREVAGAMTALAAGEHLLLIGPRGTAKTLQCELMNATLQGSTYFYWLLTRFSQPEELFGPVSYQGMRSDTFSRVLTGKLPEAHVAFLDEIFKANSAILNALLTILNERRFHNGIGAIDCPLIMLMGASNELPDGEELDALWDRFMLRYWVSDVKDRENRVKLVADDLTATAPTLTLDDLKQIRLEAGKVGFDQQMAELLVDVHDAAEKEGHDISDRRLRKSVAILKAYAYVQQDNDVTSDHFEILTDVFWQKPDSRADLAALIRKLANPVGSKAQEILDAAKEEFRKIPFTENDRAGMQSPDVAALITSTNGKLLKAIKKLEKLQNGKPNARVTEAVTELKGMHKKAVDLATRVMHGL
jgi:MoxR-like ATPase